MSKNADMPAMPFDERNDPVRDALVEALKDLLGMWQQLDRVDTIEEFNAIAALRAAGVEL